MKDIVVVQDAKKWSKKLGFTDVVCVDKAMIDCAGKLDKIRHFLEKPGPRLVYNVEVHAKRDFMHHRNSGLNHVLCKIARDKGKAVGFSFNSVLHASGPTRSFIMGRMQQNVQLCRKYKVNMVLASFAKSKWDVRSAHDMICFGQAIGMTAAEAKKALNWKLK